MENENKIEEMLEYYDYLHLLKLPKIYLRLRDGKNPYEHYCEEQFLQRFRY